MQWLDNVQTQANMSMPARSTCHSTVLAGRPQLFLPNLSCRTRSSFRVAQAQKRVARRALTVPINALQAFACYPSPRVALQTQRWAGGITPNACCLTSGDSRNGQDTTAVIVVDHGSRREASNEMLFDFVRMYRYTGSAFEETARRFA